MYLEYFEIKFIDFRHLKYIFVTYTKWFISLYISIYKLQRNITCNRNTNFNNKAYNN